MANKNTDRRLHPKAPYAISPTNRSSENEVHGMIPEALYTHIVKKCFWHTGIYFQVSTLTVDSEFGRIELLRQNKAEIALPILENPKNRRHSEFPFFRLDDYPGSEYITTEDDTLNAVLYSVLEAWPLLAGTMVLTAIAGIAMWALVCIWLCANYYRIERLYS